MKQLKNWDNKTWLSSKKYILAFHKFLKLNTKINKDSHILDIGCGRAFIISFLHNKYKFNKIPIGIDVIKNMKLKKNIQFIKIDALKYLKNSNKLFDIILIKQTIHFFSKNKIKTLLNLAKKKLNKNGQILIFSLKLKNNEIPCFNLMKLNLEKSLNRDKLLLVEIKKNLKSYKINNFNYKVVVSKKNYIKMIKNRYISCLINISENSLVKGMNEVKFKYSKRIVFKDKLICINYKN